MKSAAVPLFNYRKRQCQAILSDPQQLSTNTALTENSNGTFNNKDGVSDRIQSAQMCAVSKPTYLSSNSRLITNSDLRNNATSLTNAGKNTQRLATNSVRQRNPGLMTMQGAFVGSGATPTTTSWRQNSNTKGWSNCQVSNLQDESTNHGQGGAQAMNATTSRETTRVNCRNNTGYNSSGRANEDTNNCNKSGKFEFFNNNGRGYSHQSITTIRSPASDNYTQGMDGKIGQSQNHFKTQPSNSIAQGNSARIAQQKNLKLESDNKTSSVCKSDFNKDSQQRNRVYQNSNQKPDSCATPDMSLRIFTCTIDMVKSWTTQRNHLGLVMFEVYGVIDSAVVRDRSGTGKEFVLRDETSTITCIFYEIDREIPRLIRGQLCRVIGSVPLKLNILQVVSLRAAHADERMVCQAATELSQVEMIKLTT